MSTASTNTPVSPAMLQRMRGRIVTAIAERNRSYAEIPRDELIVVGGAAMQMYGIKKTLDIDVVVTPERLIQVMEERYTAVWQKFHRQLSRHGVIMVAVGKKEGQVITEENDGYGVEHGAITYMLAPNDHLYQATFEELRDEAERIDGVLVSPPARVLAWKRGVNRPKDAADIALIEKYLAN